MQILEGGRVLFPDGAVREASVAVQDGRIVGVGEAINAPTGAERVSLGGATVLPGFIDIHTHLTFGAHLTQETLEWSAIKAAHTARRALAVGITTVRDVGGYRGLDFSLRKAIQAGLTPGPRMFVSGAFIAETGGHTYQRARIADGPDEVRKAAREQLTYGADFVKLMTSGGVARADETPEHPQLSPAEVRAAVEEAEKRGTYVAAHAHPSSAIRMCVENGVRSIEHATYLDDWCIDALVNRNVWIVPTFGVYKHIAESGNWPLLAENAKRVLSVKQTCFHKAATAGVIWGVGTDTGTYMPVENYVLELQMLVECGFSPLTVIEHATRENAKLLGIDREVGTIEVGKLADLVVVNGDPLSDIKACGRVRFVMREGRLYEPEQLLRS